MSATTLFRTGAALLCAIALAVAAPLAAPAQTGKSAAKVTNAAGTIFEVVAHRGGADQWPENSVEAFEGSAAAGVDGIETDLRFTKDGKPVLIHDDVLQPRCTNAGQKVHQLTFVELSAVRCADLAGNLVVPIPTFAELAKVLADHPSVGLSLDLKSFPGHSVSGKQTYARWAMALLKKYGLLPRTRIVTYYWGTMLPAIRKASKSIKVVGYDNRDLTLDRVRYAVKQGATGYGIRLADTSAYLARYVRSKGLDLVPYSISGNEQRSFAIHYAGKKYFFLSDRPTSLMSSLDAGAIDLDPQWVRTTTTLASAVTIHTGTYKSGVRHYPLVLGPAVPTAARTALDKVTVLVTVTGGTGKGRVYVGPMSGSMESTSAPLPKGTATLTMKVPLGDDGKLRAYTSAKVKLTLKVSAYTNVRFS